MFNKKETLSSHIKIGNLYKFVERWQMDTRYVYIAPNEIVLLLEIVESDHITASATTCYVKMLYDGKIITRNSILTTCVNRLILIEDTDVIHAI